MIKCEDPKFRLRSFLFRLGTQTCGAADGPGELAPVDLVSLIASAGDAGRMSTALTEVQFTGVSK